MVVLFVRELGYTGCQGDRQGQEEDAHHPVCKFSFFPPNGSSFGVLENDCHFLIFFLSNLCRKHCRRILLQAPPIPTMIIFGRCAMVLFTQIIVHTTHTHTHNSNCSFFSFAQFFFCTIHRLCCHADATLCLCI